MEVRLNSGGMYRLTRDPNGPAGRWMLQQGNRMRNSAVGRANVDTGLMRSRVEFTVESGPTGVVGVLAARTGYSKYVHDGTLYYPGNPFLVDAAREVLGV